MVGFTTLSFFLGGMPYSAHSFGTITLLQGDGEAGFFLLREMHVIYCWQTVVVVITQEPLACLRKSSTGSVIIKNLGEDLM